MEAVKRLWSRISALWRGRKLDSEIDREMQFHVDMLAQEYERSGMSAKEARYSARRKFGNPEQMRERAREVKIGRILDEFRQDLFYGMRTIRRSPGFSILAVLCLTVGIGANAAIYSWIEGVLLRPYPLVADQDRLLVVSGTAPGALKGTDISWPDFLDFRRNCTLIDAFIAEKIVGTTLSVGGDRADRAAGSVVSANYFDAMGVRPILGRGFEASEEIGRKAHPVVVISYNLWQERFRGDPQIIGKTQLLNRVPHTIVGVAPKGFYGTFVGYAFQFWVPASMQEVLDPGGYKLEDRGARWIEGFARLKPGVTAKQAQTEMEAVANRLQADYPATNRGRGIRLQPLWQSPFNPMDVLGPTLRVAFAVVSAVLLIACANVGNLLLLKSFARRREMTIRLAVGAHRTRILRQLLTEGLILSAIAMIGGLVLAHWLRNGLALLFPSRGGVVLQLPAQLDWRVLIMTAGVCLTSTVLFALAPAFLSSRVHLVDALKSESGGVVGGSGKARIRSGLVPVQISLSFVLLVGAGLVIQSLVHMRKTNPGFSSDNVITTAIDFIAAGYDTQRAVVFEDELLRRIQALNGVESAAFARTTPFGYRPYSSAGVTVDGYETPLDQPPAVEYNEVGAEYFSTLGIPLVSGRDFTREDNEHAALVAVINESMAEQFWRGQNPLGKRMQVKDRSMQVVGVAKNVKYRNLLEPARPFFYVPDRQNALAQNLHIRTDLPLEMIASALVREIHAIDGNLAPTEIVTMREQINRTASSQTIAGMLLLVFGGVALLLAAIGLYGVMSYAVSQSRREMGVRMAMGAQPLELLRLILSNGLTLTGAGIVLGLMASLEVTRLLGYLLYKVSPLDPLSYGSAFLVMTVVSLAACLLPAWRVMRIDPVAALRD